MNRRPDFLVWMVLLGVLAGACGVRAQSRKRVTISGPSRVGRFDAGTSTFRSYSYGVGNLSGGGGVSNSILQSNIGSTVRSVSQQRGVRSVGGISRMVRSRQVAAPGASSAGDAVSPGSRANLQPGRAVYQTPKLDLAAPRRAPVRTIGTAPGITPSAFMQRETRLSSLGAGAAYFRAVGQDKPEVPTGEETVTSLVPDEPGLYRDQMLKGEQELLRQEYRKAARHFELARDLSMGSPESLLHLFHTHFATSSGGYSLPAHYLEATLEVFPELPLVDIQPLTFYADRELYLQDITNLETYLEREPLDPDAQLLFAYLMMREGQIDQTRQALLQVKRNANPQMQVYQAAETLWDGVVAAGLAEGELGETPNVEDILGEDGGPAAEAPAGPVEPSAPTQD